MKTSLIIGRFQPFHNAHLQDVLDALKKSDFIYLGIGSIQEKRTQKNPLTFQERKAMITAALKAKKITHFSIFQVKDVDNDSLWVETIEKVIGKPDVVFTSNPWTRRCFKKAGYKVLPHRFVKGMSATKVRDLIDSGKKWEHLVPKAIERQIKKKNLERVFTQISR